MNASQHLSPMQFASHSRAKSIALDSLSWLTLALATLAVAWPLGLTNRVLAGIDAFTYFLPYWAHRMAEMQAGRLPFWNPYLFMGAPFMANIQTAVFYPLHWPLTGLTPQKALIWSALIHIWLGAGFAYAFGRRTLRLTRPGAWLAGIAFGLGGFTLARIENINQLNALVWLPALFWLLDETARPQRWQTRARFAIALIGAMACQFLAGHTQTAFINLAGLALYAGGQATSMWWAVRPIPRHNHPGADAPTEWPLADPELRRRISVSTKPLLPLAAVLPAMLLCAVQLLPSIELNTLGLRTSGLPYREAVSFSLRPRLLAQTLLPAYGGGLAEAFTSEGYAEFVGWSGIVALLLAALAISYIWRHRRFAERHKAAYSLILLSTIGILLALGRANPLYYLLWKIAPGFALFRAPARWLALPALGIASLAGIGLDAAFPAQGKPWFDLSRGRRTLGESVRRLPLGQRLMLASAFVTLAGLGLFQLWPRAGTVVGWCAVAALTIALLSRRQRLPAAGRAILLALCLIELWAGARALPFAQATAPLALSLRNAPAALLAATSTQPPAGRDRFLSLSDIRFDPGDLAAVRSLYADHLPSEAIERLVRAAKQIEVVTPNLSMRYQLPAVDGYDGGMLPLAHYVDLQALFLPPERVLTDGRLREQLREIPADRLLDLTGVRYVVTDKQNDAWIDDVYYDLEQSATLAPGATLTLDLADQPALSATTVGIVSYLQHAQKDGESVAVITIENDGGESLQLGMGAPGDTAWAQALQPDLEAGGRIARDWPSWQGPGRDFVATLRFTRAQECRTALCTLTPRRIHIRAEASSGAPLVIRGLTLIDERTGAHQSITISPHDDLRRIYSGDVKLYERVTAPGRTWLVHGVIPVADDSAAVSALADPAFDPRAAAIITGGAPAQAEAEAEPGEGVSILAWETDHIVLSAIAQHPGIVVIADAFYPGWHATVDGLPASILQANLMFRGISVPAGTHEIQLYYRPTHWRLGLTVSLAALGVAGSILLITLTSGRKP